MEDFLISGSANNCWKATQSEVMKNLETSFLDRPTPLYLGLRKKIKLKIKQWIIEGCECTFITWRIWGRYEVDVVERWELWDPTTNEVFINKHWSINLAVVSCWNQNILSDCAHPTPITLYSPDINNVMNAPRPSWFYWSSTCVCFEEPPSLCKVLAHVYVSHVSTPCG